jgi:streptogramin lyase
MMNTKRASVFFRSVLFVGFIVIATWMTACSQSDDNGSSETQQASPNVTSYYVASPAPSIAADTEDIATGVAGAASPAAATTPAAVVTLALSPQVQAAFAAMAAPSSAAANAALAAPQVAAVAETTAPGAGGAKSPTAVSTTGAGLGGPGTAVATGVPTAVSTGSAPGATASTCPISTYASLPVSNGPVFLAASADKKIYFSNYAGDLVGWMDISASTPTPITAGLPTDDGPADLMIGPDGKVWVDEFGLTGAVQESVDEFTFAGSTLNLSPSDDLPSPDQLASPDGITLGPDGNTWITENAASAIRSVTAEGVFGPDVPTVLSTAAAPAGIVVGTDNNLWFAETAGNAIGQYDPSTGILNEYLLPTACSAPTRLVVGSDGNLWFTEVGTSKVGKMAMLASTDVTVGQLLQEYPLKTGAVPTGIAVGPDCNIWVSEVGTDSIAIINYSTNAIDESTDLQGGAAPSDLTLGADGNMWVAETGLNAIAKVTPVAGGSTACSVPVFPAVASCVTSLAVNTDPNECYATITTAELDDGSTDPNVSPAGAPAEVIGPGGVTSETLPPAPKPQNVPLEARPAARPSDSDIAPPLPVSACNVPVTVTDNQPPTITCPASQTVQCTSPQGATVAFNPTAQDNCTVQRITCTPTAVAGSTTAFPIGQTEDSCVATDNSGNVSQPCMSTVTVTDKVPPVISSIVAAPNVFPPQGKKVAINLTVADAAPCDPAPAVCQVTGIRNAINGEITGPLSISMSEDPVIILLPRIVTISVQCTDNVGNTSTGNVKVEVQGLLQVILSLL